MNRSWLLAAFGVVGLVVVASLLAQFIPNTCLTCDTALSTSCYRAATLDHVQQAKGQGRLTDVDLNLQVYASAAKLAKQNVRAYLICDNKLRHILLAAGS